MQTMEQKVLLINDSEPITAMWDGKEYELTNEPLEIERGIAEHWLNRYPDRSFRIEDSPNSQIEPRTPGNPLEDNNRGQAFAGLKRPGRRQKASGE